ncbi:hypothetical protein CAEBREN_01916 [Caenorhabditis brenneri]|uniref:MATH domain-containing protein n=1 Tax=Caenorhabditis brenneri TaxID=135651 RepID=G0MJP3_CAEBE|nr:hypothetical protein CAEBREN_01916 [Caenorhabditis brenneri]
MSGVAERTCDSQGNEPSSSAAISDESKPGFDELVQSVRKMEADQTTFKQTVMENLNVLNMRMGVLVAASGSIQKEGNGRKRKWEDIGESAEGSSKKKDASSEQKEIVPQKPIPAKIFVLKHVVWDVSNLEEGDVFQTPSEEHFGVSWGMAMSHNEGHLGLYLKCVSSGNYCIEIRRIIELKSKSGTTMRKKLATKYTENDKLG